VSTFNKNRCHQISSAFISASLGLVPISWCCQLQNELPCIRWHLGRSEQRLWGFYPKAKNTLSGAGKLCIIWGVALGGRGYAGHGPRVGVVCMLPLLSGGVVLCGRGLGAWSLCCLGDLHGDVGGFTKLFQRNPVSLPLCFSILGRVFWTNTSQMFTNETTGSTKGFCSPVLTQPLLS
jgi:hypothetical protein